MANSRFFTGFDLGQAADFTALCVVERTPAVPDARAPFLPAAPDPTDPAKGTRPRRKWKYDVRHLQLWELGTSYTVMAKDAAALFEREQLTWSTLAVDYTGVGRPVVDNLRAEKVKAHLMPILITAGNAVREDVEAREWHVPKRELVSATVAMFQSDRVRVRYGGSPAADKLVARFRKELSLFTTKISKRSANEQFGAWADGQHDDMVLALMLAIWAGETAGCGDVAGVSAEPVEETEIGRAPDGVFL
jgi:hypothetical protein